MVLPRFGGADVLEVRDNVRVPDLKPNEVLVRARAVSVNPLDTRVSCDLFMLILVSFRCFVCLSEIEFSEIESAFRLCLVSPRFVLLKLVEG